VNDSTHKASVALSVVIPVFNERENVSILCDQATEVCNRMGIEYEILFVDDGSSDGTPGLLSRIHDSNSRVRIVRFSRNFGQTAAMAAGFDHARGGVIITMDGDLQNDPSDIPNLFAKLDEGYDLVCGWRKDRKDKYITRRIPSMAANRLISWISGVVLHDNGCSLKAYRASVIKKIGLYAEMHRFIPAMASMAGARITEVVVRHHPRQFGKSKYGLSRVWKVFLDLFVIKTIVGFSTRPALWFSLLAVPFLLLAGIFLGITATHYLHPGRFTDFPIVFPAICVLLFYLSAHLISMGLLCEVILKSGDFKQRDLIGGGFLDAGGGLWIDRSPMTGEMNHDESDS
jgi:glycosyltransferase involved in cell wall biosynthesis